MANDSSSTRKASKPSTNRQLSFDSGRMKDIGSRYTPEGSDTEYGRDVDRLYAQYKPLRLAIYKRVASRLYNQSDREDLISYINEHFVRLVKEYDVTNGVDFPGFIKTLLTFRAMNSFISSLNRVYNKEESSGIQEELEEKLGYSEDSPSEYDIMEYYDDFVTYVLKNYKLTPIEVELLEGIITNERNVVLSRYLRRNYDMSQKEALETIKEFRTRLLTYFDEFNRQE